MLSGWLTLPGPQPFLSTVKLGIKFGGFIYILRVIRELSWLSPFTELSWSISRMHLNSRADTCDMIWPKVLPYKASRPEDLLEYSTAVSPTEHWEFFPVVYLAEGRENNVHSGVVAVCFWEASECKNWEAIRSIHIYIPSLFSVAEIKKLDTSCVFKQKLIILVTWG